MTLQTLAYFQTLVNYRSFTKAAQVLFISQSALSHNIQALEEELGVRLFERHGRASDLTEHGKRLLLYANQIFDDLENLNSEINDRKGKLRSPLRITVRMGLLPLKELLLKFQKLHPAIKLELYEIEMDSMAFHPWDLTFFNRSKRTKEASEVLLFEEDFVLLVHKDHPLAGKETLRLLDLEPYLGARLIFEREVLEALDQKLEEAGCRPDYLAVTDDLPLMHALVARNRAWALLPYMSQIPEDLPKQVVLRQVSDLTMKRYVYLGRNPTRNLSSSIQCFQDYCVQFFAARKERIREFSRDGIY